MGRPCPLRKQNFLSPLLSPLSSSAETWPKGVAFQHPQFWLHVHRPSLSTGGEAPGCPPRTAVFCPRGARRRVRCCWCCLFLFSVACTWARLKVPVPLLPAAPAPLCFVKQLCCKSSHTIKSHVSAHSMACSTLTRLCHRLPIPLRNATGRLAHPAPAPGTTDVPPGSVDFPSLHISCEWITQCAISVTYFSLRVVF